MRNVFWTFFLAACVFPLSGGAVGISLIEVGDFGGYRLKAPCFFGGTERLCTLDTMGEVSVVPEAEPYLRYESMGRQTLSGIGIDLTCDIVRVEDFRFLGQEPRATEVVRCPMENAALPLIGLPFLEGKTFRFDFSSSSFSWQALEGETFPLRRVGTWMAVPVSLEGERVQGGFDTGNPVTLVTPELVRRHPAAFRASSKEISASLKAKGLLPFELLLPLKVGGVELRADYVYVATELPDSLRDFPVILGMNHLIKASWGFRLDTNEFQVRAAP